MFFIVVVVVFLLCSHTSHRIESIEIESEREKKQTKRKENEKFVDDCHSFCDIYDLNVLINAK